MTVYAALRSLGVNVNVLPVIIDDEESYFDEDDEEIAKKKAKKDAKRSPERSAEYLQYKNPGKRVHVGAKLQPPQVTDSVSPEEEEGGLSAVSIICFS
jgi:hypothetical protein